MCFGLSVFLCFISVSISVVNVREQNMTKESRDIISSPCDRTLLSVCRNYDITNYIRYFPTSFCVNEKSKVHTGDRFRYLSH